MARRGNVRVSINSEFDAHGVRQAERAFNRLDGSSRSLGRSLGAVAAGTLGGVGIGAGLAKVAKDGIEFNSQMESSELALRRFVGSGAETKKFLDDLFKTAKQTPFEFTDIVKASRQLMAFGLEADQTKKTLAAVGDAVAAAGGGAEHIDRITMALGQMQAKGKVSAEELLQLTEAGIPAYRILKDELGLTSDQVANIGREGIGSEKAIQALTRGMSRDFKGAAKEQAGTWSGMTSTMRDNWAQMTGSMTKGLFGEIKRWAPQVNRSMEQITRIFKRDDIDLGDKLSLSAAVVRRRIINPLKRAFERSGLGDDLKDAIDRGLPLVMNGMTKAGGKAAGLFVKAWWNSDVWTRLLTAGFIIGKLGGFKAAGRWAAGALAASFGGQVAKDATFGTAGKAAGTKFGKGLALGVVLALPLMMPEIIKQFDELFSKIHIKTKFGIPTGIEFDAPFDIEKWSDQNLNPNRQPIGGQPTGFDMPGLTKTPRINGRSVRDGGGGSVLKNSGSIIGTPGTGTHTLGNWQSDNAVDIRIVRGTPVLAVEGGKVTKVSIRPEGGRISGSSITIHGHSGNDYFYTHLSAVSVRSGQRVQGGQVIGKSGVANGVPHLHFATREGDPRNARLENGQRVVTSLTKEQRVVARAAQKYGIDPAILWGLYGTESNFGKNLGPSSAGALGPFQFMPGTAKEYGIDPMNFEDAAFAAAKFLSRYKGRGTLGMLSAYNAGPGGALQPGYRDSVLKLARQFPTVDLEGGDTIETTPTDPRKIAQTQADARMLPIARRLRRQLAGPIGMIGGSLRRLDRADKNYTLMERRAGLVDEDLDTQEGRDARVLELTGLIGGKTNIGFQQQTHLNGIKRAIGRYKAAIASLRVQLKKAPTGQKGFIRGRIRKYRARIKDLRDEARELGFDIAETDLDVQELFIERDEAGTPPAVEAEEPEYGPVDFFDRDIAAAVFAGDKTAERNAYQAKRDWYASQLPAALLTPDPRDEEQIYGVLTSIDDWMKQTAENTEDTNRLMQQQIDIANQKAEEAQREAAAATTYAKQFPKWLADVVSGEVGGRVGLGMQSGGTPGVLAGNL